jgi:hypothetical protein
MQPVKLRRPSINISRHHNQLNEPIIDAFRLLSAVAVLGTDWCFQYAARLATAEAVDDLIVMATPDLGRLVLLEGHARLTAIFVGGLQRSLTIRAYIGLSDAIEQWGCF